MRYGILLLPLFVLFAACGHRSGNFSQYPGFDQWYAANPPSDAVPNTEDRQLLRQYQPRLFVGRIQDVPVRFYEDYIAHGHLELPGSDRIDDSVSQADLNRVRLDPLAQFWHDRDQRLKHDTQAQAIARIDRTVLPASGKFAERPLIFLTYHYVFPHSGVAAGIRSWQQWLVRILADPDDWHQLDHYTAISIVLDQQTKQPLAAMLQQHNYLRTWLLDDKPANATLALPPDKRLPVIAAIRSNELFSWREGRQFRRAVPMLNEKNVAWLIHGEDRPVVSADDITDPQIEVEHDLNFLPPSDAFFVFRGWLGERRVTPGRDAPPGADFNTIPILKPRATQLAVFFWHEDDPDYVRTYRSVFGSERPLSAAQFAPFFQRLHQALASRAPDG